MADSSRIGVMGLATMGQNLARNIAHHGIPLAVYNRTASRTEHFRERYGSEGPIFAAKSVDEFIGAIRRPRAVLLMVKAGAPVDEAIEQLQPLLEPGDILIDGGNSYYMDTRRRAEALQRQGLHFLGTGISGGEEGALKGPSIMPGGPAEAYREVEDILTAIAAEAEGAKCCTYIGTDGAGHYVKMVHNGIEYADMQLIAEAYDLLRQALQLDATRLAQ